mmetsp:Transcript_9748/g.28146  ORF Transcript_9748/g.28146 Transcript_9748/m.28146 type:complete len:203 (-) Transcript_9748:164-772(-)
MICEHRIILPNEFFLAMSKTNGQYSCALRLISSLDQINSTLLKSIPTAFHTSTMYIPTFCIFFMSPPILLFICANQSAIQNLNVTPDFVNLFTFKHFITPWAMCILPDGSNPSYATGFGFLSSNLLNSSGWMHSSPMDRHRFTRSSRDNPDACKEGSFSPSSPPAVVVVVAVFRACISRVTSSVEDIFFSLSLFLSLASIFM